MSLGAVFKAKHHPPRVLTVLGTRPEAIKLAPILLALRDCPSFESVVVSTGQHREMLDQALDLFGIVPDRDLRLMRPDQTLAGLTACAVEALDTVIRDLTPDLVMVQGDTTTVFCAALTAFYHQVPVAHVEAGLRTRQLYSPWPEEANRVLTSRLAALHFAPTVGSQDNLLAEAVDPQTIHVTGNTVIDALFMVLKKAQQHPPFISGLPPALQPGKPDGNRVVLITGHRRENFGAGFEQFCRAIARLAERFPDTHFVYPMHMNPQVREPVLRVLGGSVDKPRASNVHLIEPLDYLPFVALMNRAHLVITDSGGVQEEAPSLGKPVLVTRDTTERPEAVEAGTVLLVGTDANRIVSAASELLTDPAAYRAMSTAHNPYGDGQAAGRVISILQTAFGM